MKKYLLAFVLTVAALAGCINLDSKQGVTETGNPSTVTPIYISKQLGLVVQYPATWSVKEESATSTSAAAVFTSGDSIDKTTARFGASVLDTQPASFEEYLRQQFPGRSLQPVSFTNVTGFLFDDAAAGISGGDLQTYYFLRERLFLEVNAEIFEKARADFKSLLNGVRFVTPQKSAVTGEDADGDLNPEE